ncbi:MAG: esterase, partial [Actinomycetota bacterium]|nr:esterase [Actinomycetota bacterium]
MRANQITDAGGNPFQARSVALAVAALAAGVFLVLSAGSASAETPGALAAPTSSPAAPPTTAA